MDDPRVQRPVAHLVRVGVRVRAMVRVEVRVRGRGRGRVDAEGRLEQGQPEDLMLAADDQVRQRRRVRNVVHGRRQCLGCVG